MKRREFLKAGVAAAGVATIGGRAVEADKPRPRRKLAMDDRTWIIDDPTSGSLEPISETITFDCIMIDDPWADRCRWTKEERERALAWMDEQLEWRKNHCH